MTKTKANMCFSKSNFTLFYLAFSLFFSSTHTATFHVVNQCSYTVWAAAKPGGGQRLNSGQSWIINVPPNTTHGRIWGRTNCSFDSKGRGRCLTGDCKGLLECQDYGEPPNTLALFSLNQPNNLDYLDIYLGEGFNIPMEFSPTNNECDVIQCTGRINERCPEELKTPGGCLNPCQVFNDTDCCGGSNRGNCDSDLHSLFFKEICPDATIYPTYDGNGLFNCPGGTNYRVVFCPSKSTQDDDYTALFNTCADIPYYGVVDDTYYGVVICPS